MIFPKTLQTFLVMETYLRYAILVAEENGKMNSFDLSKSALNLLNIQSLNTLDVNDLGKKITYSNLNN